MLTLVVLFLSALATLFIAFLKKPVVTLFTSVTGLVLTGVVLMYQWTNGVDILTSYEGVYFDVYATFFSLAAIGFTLLVILSGYGQFKLNLEYTGDFMALLMFSLLGAMLMVSFQNLFVFFLGLEILSIPIYVMAGSNKEDSFSSEAALKYFITGAFATGTLLFGIAWMYGATGSFNLNEIGEALSNNTNSMAYLGLILIMSAFLFKIGAAPFHFWSPDVYDGSPAPVTGYMATVIKLGAFGAFVKLFGHTFYGMSDFWMPALTFLAIMTMFIGNLSAIRQDRFKRFLAYSSISHIGYTLITLIALSDNSTYNAWFYLTSYGFATIALITIQIVVNDKEDRIEAFKGLGRSNPLIGIVAVVSLLALAGVPPLMGFFGKYIVFVDAIAQHPLLIVIALINSSIGIYYYLRIVIIFLSKSEEETTEKFVPSFLQSAVMLICLIGLLFGGVFLMM
ncbi:MAG: NADH-quinone oxidoreductase subunit N [Crocinitomicaceae bacterium]|nr:NADH-quinone oxidoreductase subunit N [Crocinitomicaceae bacterium]